MFNNPTTKKWILFLFLILIYIIGAKLVSYVANDNIYVTRGLFGCVALYFVYRALFSEDDQRSFEILLIYPQNIKYFIIMLGLSMFVQLAVTDIGRMIGLTLRSLFLGVGSP